MSFPPRLTIITVTFNDSIGLEQTIKSVYMQYMDQIEYIIIDGGSNDNTHSILNKYKKLISYWISEPDKGIYDAMNKGIKIASGDALLFLNAGDVFVGDVINDKNFKFPALIPVKYKTYSGKLKNFKQRNYKYSHPYCHQGIIFENKKLLYNTKFKIAADFDYYLRHGYKNLPFIETTGYILYDNNGVSTNQYLQKYAEIGEIIKNYFPSFNYYLYKSKSLIKHLIKTIFKRLNLKY